MDAATPSVPPPCTTVGDISSPCDPREIRSAASDLMIKPAAFLNKRRIAAGGDPRCETVRPDLDGTAMRRHPCPAVRNASSST